MWYFYASLFIQYNPSFPLRNFSLIPSLIEQGFLSVSSFILLTVNNNTVQIWDMLCFRFAYFPMSYFKFISVSGCLLTLQIFIEELQNQYRIIISKHNNKLKLITGTIQNHNKIITWIQIKLGIESQQDNPITIKAIITSELRKILEYQEPQ